MYLAFNGSKRGGARRRHLMRLSWMSTGGTQAFQLLQGCPVVTIEGDTLGSVDGLMVDTLSHKPRFVTLKRNDNDAGALAIPWQSLYFDSTLARLVYYTYSDNAA